MIALCKMEFYKLWRHTSFLIFLITLLCFNVGYLFYTQAIEQDIPHVAYTSLEQTLQSLPNNQRYEFITQYQKEVSNAQRIQQMKRLYQKNDTDSINQRNALQRQYPELANMEAQAKPFKPRFAHTLQQEMQLIDAYKKEFNILHQYPEYLQTIKQHAEQLQSISLFTSQESYSIKNIKKTAQDYEKLYHTPITYQSEKGIIEALTPFTSILILLAIFAISANLITEEKQRQLFTLIKSTPNGQMKTMLCKLLVMYASIFIITTIFFAINFSMMQQMYGLGDFNRSIQSLAHYSRCTLNINVASFLLLFLSLKTLTLCVLGSLIVLFSLKFHHPYVGLFSILALLGMSACCFYFIDANGPLRLLRYCNVYTLLQSEVLLQDYVNFRISNTPVSLLMISCIVILLFFIIVFGICICTYRREITSQQRSSRFLLSSLPSFIPLSLWKMEIYKFAWLQKAFILCFLFCGFLYMQYQSLHSYVDAQQLGYIQYIKQLEGPYTKKSERFLQEEAQRFDTLYKKRNDIELSYQNQTITKQERDRIMMGIDQQLSKEGIFQDIQAYATYVKKDSRREFVIPYGHEQLLLQDAYIMFPTLYLLIFLTLLFSNIFTFDYHNQMSSILHSTPKGIHRIVDIKLGFIGIGIILTYLLTYLPYMYYTSQLYGLQNWNASITSIQAFQQLPSSISILQYYLFTYLLRFLAIGSSVLFTCIIAIRTKQQLAAIFFTFLWMVVPLLLYIIDIHYADAISIICLLRPDSFPFQQLIVTIIIYCSVSCFGLYYTRQHHISIE